MLKKIIFSFLILCAIACANKNLTPQPIEGKALAIVESSPFQDQFIPLKMSSTVFFSSLDDEPISNMWTATEKLNVEPGEHTLILSCRIFRGFAELAYGLSKQKLNFEAGKIYRFKAVILNGACGTEVSISNK